MRPSEVWRSRGPHALWLLPPLLALLPHLDHVPLWLGLVCLGVWFWRLALELGNQALPPRSMRALLALAGLAAVFWQYGSIVGQQAGVPLFLLLLFIKLLESRGLAEKRLLLILTQFAAMSYFLMGQSILVSAYLLLVSVLGVAVMLHLQAEGRQPLLRTLTHSSRLFAVGLPLALLLFLLFPRLDRPLWGLPTDTTSAATGLSENMAPGDIARLIQSGETAFRAQFTGPRPDPNGLYWRGIVLSGFDGRVWHALPPQPASRDTLQAQGTAWRLSLTLEPHQRRWLFTPGLPEPLPQGTRLAQGFQWLANEPVRQRQRWFFQVYPAYHHASGPGDLQRELILPEGFNPRARELAQGWRQRNAAPQILVDQALALFRKDFIYTLRPPALGVHSVDDFLFGTRRGFCEHYAGGFVFLMRAAGVPARVVTGYLGGEVNPLDGHLLVRQSDAHAWAEVWLGPETGWVRVDPTAAISPARVEQGIGAALPATELPAALTRLSVPLLQGLRHTWEMLNNRWDQWVLGYGQAQQLQLLARLSPRLASTRWLAQAAILAGLLGLALLAGFFWRTRPKETPDAAARAWLKLQQRLGRIGLAPLPAEPPLGYCARVARLRPDLADPMRRITRLYLDTRYGNQAHELRSLARLVARFRPRRHRESPGNTNGKAHPQAGAR
ncbi:MAG TPA: DUF3488 and transglutaminase-like domain-containing protein [Thiobacillaceae bacterium]|nr:DUF3488 and transglutaminase-like domain-containing protein [Thiobacillaceae bacterium]HNU63512.1 DUF3488 and transglutaminase-like domain-containing protein [Thiobacillaceae bacterium]